MSFLLRGKVFSGFMAFFDNCLADTAAESKGAGTE